MRMRSEQRNNQARHFKTSSEQTCKPHGKSTLQGRVLRALPVVGLVLGVLIILYYPVTEAIDAYRRGQIAQGLDAEAAQIDTTKKDELLSQADAYNKRLVGLTPGMPLDQILPYELQLSKDGHNTAFGYIQIPKLDLTMPLYRGTSDAALSAGVGHLEWSSLPVGGASTHAVLSAHSGMEGMRAFDDIHLLKAGDVFGIKVLGDLRCYRVSTSEVVLPSDAESLTIEQGKDLCTLVTCTPYGVNTHRLLVHAERCEVPDNFLEEKPSPLTTVASIRVWPALLAAGVVGVVITVLLVRRKRNGGRRNS